MKISFLALVMLLLTTLSTQAQWNKVKTFAITFKIKNAGLWVNGNFATAKVQVNVDENNPSQSLFSGVVEAKSISTGIKLRDNHLRDKDEFFDVDNFPTLTMKSVSVTKKSDGIYDVKWSLTIKGITKLFSSQVIAKTDGNTLKISSIFTINRNDWKLGGSSFTMGDNVTINLTSTVTK